jgi:hypothetical protein
MPINSCVFSRRSATLRLRLLVIIGLLLAAAIALVMALPGPSACLLVDLAALHRLPDGSLASSAFDADQARYVQLTREARLRIKARFGAPEAKPVLVFFNHTDGFGPFHLNAHGSTQFIGSRACVMVGPKGQNIDVIAHELMHAEIHYRAGYFKRWLQLPTWLDEGLAMQVDERERYRLPPQAQETADKVRELNTAAQFFKGDEAAIVNNYAMAKLVVAGWLKKAGPTSLYARLQRLKQGEPFESIMAAAP